MTTSTRNVIWYDIDVPDKQRVQHIDFGTTDLAFVPDTLEELASDLRLVYSVRDEVTIEMGIIPGTDYVLVVEIWEQPDGSYKVRRLAYHIEVGR